MVWIFFGISRVPMPRRRLSGNGDKWGKGQDTEFNNINNLCIRLFCSVEIISLSPWQPEEGSIICVSEPATEEFITSGLWGSICQCLLSRSVPSIECPLSPHRLPYPTHHQLVTTDKESASSEWGCLLGSQRNSATLWLFLMNVCFYLCILYSLFV